MTQFDQNLRVISLTSIKYPINACPRNENQLEDMEGAGGCTRDVAVGTKNKQLRRLLITINHSPTRKKRSELFSCNFSPPKNPRQFFIPAFDEKCLRVNREKKALIKL